MKRLFIFLCSIFAFNLALAIGPDPILEKRLKEHTEAYKILEKELPNLEIYHQVTHSGNRTIKINYSYGGTKEAVEANKKYSDAFYNLIYKTYYNAMGNGFIIGVITAILNKNLSNKKINIYTIVLPIIASIANTVHENEKMGSTPFFHTGELYKNENLFSNTNIKTFGRIILTIGSSIISSLGTDYALDKTSWSYQNATKKTPIDLQESTMWDFELPESTIEEVE